MTGRNPITEIIARLGHACGLPWATRARGIPSNCPRCGASEWFSDEGDCCWCETAHTPTPRTLPPTLAEWHAEHEREHPGEPGPVASWTSEDGRVRWSVDDVGPKDSSMLAIRIQVGSAEGLFYGPIRRITIGTDGGAVADAAEAVRLVQAAYGGGT